MSDDTALRRLQEAYEILKGNEKAYHNVRKIRHRIIASRTVYGVITELIEGLHRLDVDQVNISLVRGMIYNDTRLMEALPPEVAERILFVAEDELTTRMSPRDIPVTMVGRPNIDLSLFFHPDRQPIMSCVLCPMVYQASLMGTINLGSHSPHRFPPDLSPIYLEDLAATAALCIDNAISHEFNERMAVIDPLTGVHNRRYFFEHAVRIFELAKRNTDPMSCLYVDLDGFKHINDTLGHETGDEALKRIAQAIENHVRRSDIFARLGGDEFAVILPRTDGERARRVADDIQRVIGRVSISAGQDESLRLSASVGIAVLEDTDSSVYKLINRADEAMYREKSDRKAI